MGSAVRGFFCRIKGACEMRLDNMRYVIAVSRWKSINKASKHLYINQQQLSRIIASVENELGIEIFNRSSKGAFLTAEGERVVRRFGEILAIYDSLCPQTEQPEEPVKGSLTILTEINVWTGYARFYRDFVRDYPEIGFAVKAMATQEIIRYLSQEEAIGMITQIIGEGIVDYAIPDELAFLPVAQDHIMVYGAADNPYLKKYKSISLATLCQLPLINFKPYTDQPSLLERVFAHVGRPNIKYEVSDSKVFRELAISTDCLFLTFRRPKYVADEAIGELALRDRVVFANGILRRREALSKPYQVFADYYLSYYSKLY